MKKNRSRSVRKKIIKEIVSTKAAGDERKSALIK